LAFNGVRVLIVEDEPLVSMFIEDILVDLNCEVAGIAATIEQATEQAGRLEFDVAILDVNMSGREIYPLARTLMGRGVPFVLSTGYGAAGLPEEFRSIPALSKPFRQAGLEEALTRALAPAR
jgi:CheY-like chemotaxis protein